MKMLVEGLEQKLGNNVFSDLDLRTRIEDILLDLHKRYNLRSSKTLSRDTLVFKPSSILGVRLKDDSYCIYQIEFYEDGPRIDPIDVQEAVGSASIFAKHDLKEESRFLASYGKSFSDLELRYNIWVASYVVNKIKEFDADPIWFTWGTTKVAIIDKNGFADINIDKNGFADINDKKVSRPMFPNR